MVKVKICGITSLEDALNAADLEADILGFNFYQKSPRYILPEAAKEIVDKLPAGIRKVGVFVNEPQFSILEIANYVGLDAIQLHGDENLSFIDEMRKCTNLELIKAIRVSSSFDTDKVSGLDADAILLDVFSKAAYGGTGETFDWRIAQNVRERVGYLFLAGGLSADNVATAIDLVKPYAVDVASGVESEKGKKDLEKMRAFIRNAKRA